MRDDNTVRAICGYYRNFPSLMGNTGDYDKNRSIFFPDSDLDSDPDDGYFVPRGYVYVPSLDGEIFPVEKYMQHLRKSPW